MSGAEASTGAPGTLELRRYLDEDARATYLDTGGEFLLGLVDGRLEAIGALRHASETDAEIKRMRVHPRFQRRGFAHALLAQHEDYARQRGYRRLRFDTTLLQIAAQRFFEREGYREVGRGQAAGVALIYYAKRLP